MNDSFWIKKPSDLFSEVSFIPCRNCSLERNMNRITKFVIIVAIIIAAFRKSVMPLYIGIFVIILIALFYFLGSKNEKFTDQSRLLYTPDNPTEVRYHSDALSRVTNYTDPMVYRELTSPVNTSNEPSLRYPSKNNPFMNVMPLDYGATPIYEDYPRYENSNDQSPFQMQVREEVDIDFKDKLWQNEDSKLFERLNSQRQFVSQPIGSVPNKQDEFSNWLYGNQYGTCKEGSIYSQYGLEYTDQSLLCTGFNAAEPTNQGTLDNLMSSVER